MGDDLTFLAIFAMLFLVFVLLPLMVIVAILVWAGRRHRPFATLVATVLIGAYLVTPLPRMGAGVLYLAIPPLRVPMARLDLALSRGAREEVVRLATSGHPPHDDHNRDFTMPASARGLSVHGTVEILNAACGQRVFFMTLTGMSPDPYAGFEYVPPGCQPEPDPEGSGHGVVESFDGNWYWIVAS